jgi:hypothetical protein
MDPKHEKHELWNDEVLIFVENLGLGNSIEKIDPYQMGMVIISRPLHSPLREPVNGRVFIKFYDSFHLYCYLSDGKYTMRNYNVQHPEKKSKT